jgi:EmrB/QacA subfamily drug resistance transporter
MEGIRPRGHADDARDRPSPNSTLSPDTTLSLVSPAGRLLVAALVLGSSATFLYASVVNVALPAIGDDLDVGLAGLQWVVNGYVVAMAALILVGGSAGDVLGRRRVYVASCGALVAGSVICLAAPNLGVLVGGRLVQGIGAAGVTPISLALVDASFAEHERGRAVGLWASGSAITTAGGPFLGGVLVDSLNWRWVFALAIPLLIASATIVARLVPDAPHRSIGDPARRFDPTGGVLGVVAIGGSVVALTEGLRGGWGEPAVVVSGLAALAATAAFVPVERRRRDPMVPMRLFGSRQFSGANGATALVYFAINGGFFFTAVAFQTVVGYSPSVAGASLVPANLVMILGSPVVGRLAGRFGPRWLVAGGAVVLGTGFALLAPVDAGADYATEILPAAIVLGIGFALMVPPLTAAVLAATDERDIGVGAAVNNAVARTAGLLATALLPGLVDAPADTASAGFVDAYQRALVVVAALCVGAAGIAAATIGRCVSTHTAQSPSPLAGCSQVSVPVRAPATEVSVA